jgi:tetratricopeptide (TPR) repeat protein
VAIQVLVAGEVVSAAGAKDYLRLARSLADEAFPARQAANLRQQPALPGSQATRLRRLADQVSLYLAARLHPGEAALQPARARFEVTAAALSAADREITFFCAETVAGLARRETARGARAFARGELAAARQHLETASAYDADNPLPVWNLARLALAEGRRLEALECYAALLEIWPEGRETLRAELDAATGRQPEALARLGRPVDRGMNV